MTEVGFLAAARGDVRHAEKIFGALRLIRPQRAFAPIGLAMALLNTGNKEEAVRVLGQSLVSIVDPDERSTLEAFRGLALQLAGRRAESLSALRAAGTHPLALAMLGRSDVSDPARELPPLV